MNYERNFYRQPALEKQPIAEYGTLRNPNNKHLLSTVEVDAYNHYTRDFNKTNWRATQEFLLDQRHRFFVSCRPNL